MCLLAGFTILTVSLPPGQVAKGEKRCRHLQEKLDAKNKEVINLLEALKTAEEAGGKNSAQGENRTRLPQIGAEFPQVLHRIWAGGMGWVLLSGMGEDGEADWFCESTLRSVLSGLEESAGGIAALDRAGVPVVLEEVPMRENKISELMSALEKKQQEFAALQEDFRAYKE